MLTREQVVREIATLLAIGSMIPTNEQVKVHLDKVLDTDAALRARITHLETALRRSSDDNLEYLKCQPGCNSYGHDEHCAVANPRLEFDRLRAELAVYDAVVEALTATADTTLGQCHVWQKTAADLTSQVEALTRERDKAQGFVALLCGPSLPVQEECVNLKAQLTEMTRQVADKLADATEAWATVNERDQTITARDEQLEIMEAQLAASQACLTEIAVAVGYRNGEQLTQQSFILQQIYASQVRVAELEEHQQLHDRIFARQKLLLEKNGQTITHLRGAIRVAIARLERSSHSQEQPESYESRTPVIRAYLHQALTKEAP